MIKTLLLSKLIVLLFFSVSFAQEKDFSQQKKFVFVNKYAFDNGKNGIIKLSQAYDFLAQANCFPLHQSEIFEIKKELENPSLSKEEREKKKSLLETLSKEQKENSEKQYERQKKILIDPILSELADLLKKVETQNNIIILDAVEIEAKSQLLALDAKLDITKQFIAFLLVFALFRFF